MVQVTVAGMILDQQTRGPILLLHIPPLDRYMPIWIGTSEGASIGMALKNEKFERPLTHDLVATIIDGLGGRITKVSITDQRNNTFFAKIYIERGQQVIAIDARPSDSIAIAMRAGAPIFVADEVLEREKDHLLTLDEETTISLFDESGSGPFPEGEEQPPGPDSAEEHGGSEEGDETS